jgi:hypothetical protein
VTNVENDATTPVRRNDLPDDLVQSFEKVGKFSEVVLTRRHLRSYQAEPAQAIADSIARHLGRQFAIVFSRQAGKDELLAQLLAFLLSRYREVGGNAVVGAPTFHPQAALTRDRLLDRLANPFTARLTHVRDGYAVYCNRASARFLSASPGANARGQTADLLLVANEAQDIKPEVWDAVFDPMAASTNATTVFMGTVWSRNTLLARQMRHLEEMERQDGVKRVWRVPWERVAIDLPAYGERVRARIAQLGANHPFIKTEYCLEELDGEGGLFPAHRLAQMRGDHPRRHHAEPGKRYALLIDVAGEEEAGTGPLAFDDVAQRAPGRDSTALTVVEVNGGDGQTDRRTDGERSLLLSVSPSVRLPTYRVVDRLAWTGEKHTMLHARIVDLAREVWRTSVVVVDATGVGAGLASFLAAALGERRSGRTPVTVIPYLFTAASKSALGWDFLALIDGGRFKEYADDSASGTPAGRLTALYWDQLRETTYETVPGPGKLLRWSVPAARGHDDLVISAALTAALDDVDWRPRRAVGR